MTKRKLNAIGYEGSYLVPLSPEDIEQDGIVYIGNKSFSKNAIFIFGGILELPLIILYSIWRSRFKKKRYESELKKMKLDSITNIEMGD